jgi:hypothetical protein
LTKNCRAAEASRVSNRFNEICSTKPLMMKNRMTAVSPLKIESASFDQKRDGETVQTGGAMAFATSDGSKFKIE